MEVTTRNKNEEMVLELAIYLNDLTTDPPVSAQVDLVSGLGYALNDLMSDETKGKLTIAVRNQADNSVAGGLVGGVITVLENLSYRVHSTISYLAIFRFNVPTVTGTYSMETIFTKTGGTSYLVEQRELQVI